MAKKKKEKNVLYGPSPGEKIVKIVIIAAIVVAALLVIFKLVVPAVKDKISDRKVDKQTEESVQSNASDGGGDVSQENADAGNSREECYTPKQENIIYDEETGSGYVNNMVIVYVQDGTAPEKVDALAEAVNGEVIGSIPELNEYQIQVEAAEEEQLEELCTRLETDEIVTDARVDDVIQTSADYTPNDKWGSFLFFKEDWDEEDPGGKNWHLETVKVPSAWNLLEQESSRVNNVPIGILEAGIYRDHEDIRITQAADQNLVTQEHGTEVTGVAGAIADNEKGLTGIAKDSEIFFYGFVRQESEFEDKNRTSWTIPSTRYEDGINDLLKSGCRSINLSFGGFSQDDQYAEDHGQYYADVICRFIHTYGKKFMLVQSAGNDGKNAKYNAFFCSVTEETVRAAIKRLNYGNEMTVEDVMGAKMIVGAADKKEKKGKYQLADFSNYGENVDICAPGVDIYTSKKAESADKSKYASVQGTSFSAPMVTAIAGLVWSANNDLTATQVKDILISTGPENVTANSSHKKEDPGNASRTYHMVDAAAAVQKAFDTEPEKDKDPVKEYEDAVDKTIGDGEWTEKTTMRIDMGVNKDASTAASLIECNYNLHVTDYSAENPSAAKAQGTATGYLFGSPMDYDIRYADGVTTYTMKAPFPLSYDVPGEASVFDFSMISDRTVQDASMNGQTITFDLTKGEMPDSSFSFITELAQMENVEMDQATVTVKVSDDGMLDMITMDILGSLVYGDESLDTAFTLQYEFDD